MSESEQFTAESMGFTAESIPADESPFSKNGSSSSTRSRRTRSAPVEDEFDIDSPRLKPDTKFIVDNLRKTYVGIGLMVRPFDPMAGINIATSANDLAESWITVLEANTKLRRTMKKMVQGGGWGNVLIAHLLVALPIMESHGISLSHLIRRKNNEDEGTEIPYSDAL